MDITFDEQIHERNELTIDEASKLLWEWRKYRNGVFWNSVYRWCAVSVGLTIAPYLLPDLIGKLGFAIFVFPILTFLLSIFAAYVITVQYMLYKQVDRKFRLLLGKFTPDDIPDKPVNRLFRKSIGKMVVLFILCYAVIIQLFNGVVLFNLVNRVLP